MPDTSAIIVCAGNASRMGGIDKILMPLGNGNAAGYSMLAMERTPEIDEIIVVTRPGNESVIRDIASALGVRKLAAVTGGGETRQESVRCGVRLVAEHARYIAIHDGARPLVRPEDVSRVIEDAHRFGCATLGVPVKDTIKVVEDGTITDTPPRERLFLTQTPQVFRKELYLQGLAHAQERGLDFTDDCQLVEAIGERVHMTSGSYSNLKITTPEDQKMAEALL